MGRNESGSGLTPGRSAESDAARPPRTNEQPSIDAAPPPGADEPGRLSPTSHRPHINPALTSRTNEPPHDVPTRPVVRAAETDLAPPSRADEPPPYAVPTRSVVRVRETDATPPPQTNEPPPRAVPTRPIVRVRGADATRPDQISEPHTEVARPDRIIIRESPDTDAARPVPAVPRAHETDHTQIPQVLGEQAEALRIVHEQQAAALVELTQQVASVPGGTPVSIYLADEKVGESVEKAVEQWLAMRDVRVYWRGEPVIGSWFRAMAAKLKGDAALTTLHKLDNELYLRQDAQITATLLQSLAPVVQSLEQTKDAVVRIGAVLIVKIDWELHVQQLTAAQQAILAHPSLLAVSPREIVGALQLTEPVFRNGPLPSTVQAVGRGEAAAATGN
jgi:hypothetical protein